MARDEWSRLMKIYGNETCSFFTTSKYAHAPTGLWCSIRGTHHSSWTVPCSSNGGKSSTGPVARDCWSCVEANFFVCDPSHTGPKTKQNRPINENQAQKETNRQVHSKTKNIAIVKENSSCATFPWSFTALDGSMLRAECRKRAITIRLTAGQDPLPSLPSSSVIFCSPPSSLLVDCPQSSKSASFLSLTCVQRTG